MKHTRMTRLLRRSALVLALLSLLAGTVSAQAVDLVADEFTWNGIDMWGFVADTGQGCGGGGTWAPGPTIEVDLATAADLTINLRNCLADPVSIVIPGQGMPTVDGLPSSPTFVASSVPGQPPRAASVVSEVGFGQTRQYVWSNPKPGTFLYTSGSDLARQVHMGLYGAAVVNVDSANGEAYPGIFFDQDIVVLYSAVDPDLHATAAAAKPLTYTPKFFLVNGDATGTSTLTAPAAPLNTNVLLRFVNAGLKSYVPTLLGEDMDWIAEDGNPYPFARRAYSAFLAAGQTMDAIWVPNTVDRHALYDRRLYLTGNGIAGGGLRAFLDSANANVPTATIGGGASHVALGTPIQLTGSASGGSGTYTAYDWTLVSYPAGSSATLVPDGLDPAIVTLTPDVPGTYTAQLVVTDDLGATSFPATANVFTNLPPVAVAGADQTAFQGDTIQLDGSQSYDPDGDAIVSYLWTVTDPDGLPVAAAAGVTSSFTATKVGLYSVELTVNDGELDGSDTMHVTTSVAVNQPPIAGNDYYQVVWKTMNNVLYVLANDSDPDGTLVPVVTIGTMPMNGASAVPQADGTIWYTPKNGFKGTDFFTYFVCDDQNACSEAEVLVNVVK